MSSKNACPNCGITLHSVLPFYEVKEVPVHSCVILPTKQEAQRFLRGDISLGFCKACGFIFNMYYDPSLLDYSSTYEDQQSFSPTFNAFARDLANHLIVKYSLHNKEILEIGCGKGDFLALLCELGNNRGIGIDPAYVATRIHRKSANRLTFIKDYYSERYANYHGDLVCCRHTLEHIQNTAEFVSSIRRSIGDRLNTVLFLEIPDTIRILQELAFWDIYYEHCSYFSPGSLARLLRSCKFEIVDLSRSFRDQYLLIEVKPVTTRSSKPHELEESLEDLMNDVKYFSEKCLEKIERWKNYLKQLTADREHIVIWGSGSKCVSFMTTLNINDEVEYVIDINPYRHQKFLPGLGKEIMPPEVLKKHKPDITLVMNPVYCEEIQQMLKDMKVDTKIVPVE
jgi:SAM-dependent methyltransferase